MSFGRDDLAKYPQQLSGQKHLRLETVEMLFELYKERCTWHFILRTFFLLIV